MCRDVQRQTPKKRSYKKLTEEDKEFLQDNYLILTDKQLGVLLGRSSVTIRKHRQLLGLKRDSKSIREALAERPIVVWLPLTAYKDKKLNLEKLKIQEN